MRRFVAQLPAAQGLVAPRLVVQGLVTALRALGGDQARALALALLAALLGLMACEPGSENAVDPNVGFGQDASVAATPAPAPAPQELNICRTDTVDSCGQCAYRCPGPDDATTMRICEGNRCGLVCRGTAYDVDGEPSNGCEAQDDLAERQLAPIGDCDSSGGSVSGRILSDTRRHAEPPTERADGGPDRYRIPVEDGVCFLDPLISLQVMNAPPGVEVELEARFVCADDKQEYRAPAVTVANGQSKSVMIDMPTFAPCSGSDNGALILEVSKRGGPAREVAYLLRYRS
ncbi:MAG: hypothetical protein IPL40_09030 [Proteobacteria bacterium]|nr:hypothetical protein [Pseudomonadota bacterium]